MSYFVSRSLTTISALALLCSAPAWAHHDSVPASGGAAMVEHVEQGEELILELMMPHSRAAGNQLLLNFFTADNGQSVQPEIVRAAFSSSGSTEWSEPVTLVNNGPVYAAPAAGITGPGEWIIRVDVQLDQDTQTAFFVSSEFY